MQRAYKDERTRRLPARGIKNAGCIEEARLLTIVGYWDGHMIWDGNVVR